MHCVSSYPLQSEKELTYQNWKKIKSLADQIGHSGHMKGINDAIAAICMGATYIEKHFTIDNNLPGRDNLNSIIPEELKYLSNFRQDFQKMKIDHGLDVQDIELDIYKNYRGRWG